MYKVKLVTLVVGDPKARTVGLMSRVFVNGPGDRRSIPDRVIPKTQKIVLDAT